jgi:hypothetical protein
MARIRSTPGVSLARNPETLADRAVRRFAGWARAVRMRTRYSGRSADSSPAAVRPFWRGRSMSRIATSGCQRGRQDLVAVGDLGDDVHVVLEAEDSDEGVPEDGRVLCEQD